MADTLLIKAEPLERLAAGIFVAAGTPQDLADHVARHLVKANLSGHDSHGVIRIPSYVRSINSGSLVADARPEVVRQTPGAAVVDGKRGFGQVAASYALDVAINKAAELGVGAASIRRCNHIGRLGDYGEAAAARGYIAMVIYGSAGPNSGHAAPFGGASRHLGTNPWSIGIPGGEGDAVVVDFATTVVAEGKIQVARAKHVPLPPGCIVDKDGQPSTTAEDFYNGGMILPVGGHKGYGLSLVAALLGAGLTSERPPENGRGGGVFVLAVDPRAFSDGEVYGQTIDAMTGSVTAVAPAPGVSDVMLPGGPEVRSRAERQAQGVPIPEDTWTALVETASRLRVDVPQPA
jgi:LDH2 family malate/lactate/ureidoglycolate dehydrogenase